MTRKELILARAKLILDDLYTSDTDIEIMADMSIRQVSTDAPILLRTIKVENPHKIVDFYKVGKCVDDEDNNVDCCNNSSTTQPSNDNIIDISVSFLADTDINVVSDTYFTAIVKNTAEGRPYEPIIAGDNKHIIPYSSVETLHSTDFTNGYFIVLSAEGEH